MKGQNSSQIEKLLTKGVKVHNPESIEIGDEVLTERISGNGVHIYPGCRIFGSSTLILKGAIIGYEGPVTIENCQIGPDVELKGGFFREAVFLKNAAAGSGSHVREGTILEEYSSIAHTAGLKQTILFPFVTLGSLINFCDCLMSGGRSRKDHSEVGSSYIHSNFTPNQDKATASLIGDVPNGVMLNQNPIFLGGQGGLVGPCRLAFGTIIAAGSIYRKDVLKPDRLLVEKGITGGDISFNKGIYQSVKRIVKNNTIYIANLMALKQWYIHVRSHFVSDDFPEALCDGLKEKLDMGIDERLKRLKGLSQKMPESIAAYQKNINKEAMSSLLRQKNELFSRWDELEDLFNLLRKKAGCRQTKDVFLEKILLDIKKRGKDYLSVIKGLELEDSKSGTLWLQGIVDHITAETFKILPSFNYVKK